MHPTTGARHARRRAAELFDDIALHEEMLADSVRLDAYYAAIERYVRPQHSVVDIGALGPAF